MPCWRQIASLLVATAWLLGTARSQELAWVSVDTASIDLAPGMSSFCINFKIRDDIHIQADHGASENLFGASLQLEDDSGLTIERVDFLDPELLVLPGSHDTLRVFSKRMMAKVKIRRSDDLAGMYTLHGTLRFQACTMRRCFFPRKLNLTLCLRLR